MAVFGLLASRHLPAKFCWGLGGLVDRSHRPDPCRPYQAPVEVAICELRREHLRWGLAIAQALEHYGFSEGVLADDGKQLRRSRAYQDGVAATL